MKLKHFPVILIFSGIFACAVQQNQQLTSGLANVVKNLDNATFLPIRKGWQYDYGFKDGWMLNKFEYVRSLLSYKDLQKLTKHSIYLSGPHSNENLALDAKYEFGHYNPKFLAEFHTQTSQLLKDEHFVRTTKPILEKYDLLNALEKHKEIYEIIQKNPQEFNAIKMNYLQGLKTKSWEQGAYRTNMPQRLNSSEYWNWSESSYHLWVRRDIDNTKELWIKLVNDILMAYRSKS